MEKGKMLLSLLRAEIMGERAEILSDFIEISALMNMAKKQDFLHVIASALLKTDIFESDAARADEKVRAMKAACERAQLMGIYRYETLMHAQGEILRIFSEVHHAGLSVRPRDTDDRQAVGGIFVPRMTQASQNRSCVFNVNCCGTTHKHITHRLCHDHRSTLRYRFSDFLVTVYVKPPYANVQASSTDLSRIGYDIFNFNVSHLGRVCERGSLEQHRELHSCLRK